MDVPIVIAGATCLLATLLACYFSACNIALRTFSRTRVADLLERAGKAHRLEPFVERVDHYLLITAMLRTCLGFVILLSALYLIQRQTPHWDTLGQYAAAFLVSGFLVSIFIVGIPTAWGRHASDRLVASSIPVLQALLPLRFFATLLNVFDPVVRRITGVDEEEEDENQLSNDVLSVVEDHQRGQPVDEVQKEMLEAVFELPQTTAGEIMTPRTEIKSLEVAATLDAVRDTVIRHGHSRIPVYQDNLDQIVGVLYAKDLLRFIGGGDVTAFNLRELVRPAFVVPESKGVRELLSEFKANKVHLALVLDEYGGTAGLVTIEDILEEIVGEIQDEYEPQDETQLVRVDDQTTDVDARMHIDDFNAAVGTELPEDEDYDTIGGYVSSVAGRIPRVGEAVEAHGMRFTVTDAERTKVKRVRVQRLQLAPADAAVTTGK